MQPTSDTLDQSSEKKRGDQTKIRASASNSTHFAMNLPNRRAAKLILLGDLRVRVRVRVRISGENRTCTPTRTLPSLKLDALKPKS